MQPIARAPLSASRTSAIEVTAWPRADERSRQPCEHPRATDDERMTGLARAARARRECRRRRAGRSGSSSVTGLTPRSDGSPAATRRSSSARSARGYAPGSGMRALGTAPASPERPQAPRASRAGCRRAARRRRRGGRPACPRRGRERAPARRRRRRATGNGSARRELRLADDEHLVAGLGEQPMAALGERLPAEPGERLGEPNRREAPPTRSTPVSGASSRSIRVAAPCRPSPVPSRTKPQSVTPRSSASSTASDEGAPTATRIGQPGDGGLLHELEREPAADAEDRPRERQAPLARRPSRRPCPSRCGGRRPRGGSRSSPSAREEPGRVEATGERERRLGLAEPLRQRSRRRRTAREVARRPAAPRPRPPRARPSRRHRTTTTCRTTAGPGRVGVGRLDLDDVRGEIVGGACGDGLQALREAEAERELLVVPRRAHRHGDRACRSIRISSGSSTASRSASTAPPGRRVTVARAVASGVELIGPGYWRDSEQRGGQRLCRSVTSVVRLPLLGAAAVRAAARSRGSGSSSKQEAGHLRVVVARLVEELGVDVHDVVRRRRLGELVADERPGRAPASSPRRRTSTARPSAASSIRFVSTLALQDLKRLARTRSRSCRRARRRARSCPPRGSCRRSRSRSAPAGAAAPPTIGSAAGSDRRGAGRRPSS